MQLSFADKEHFFHGLAQMLRSGIPAGRSLEHIGAGRDRAAHAARCAAARIGEGFGVAMEAAGFSPVDVEILAAGEQCGRLEEACERLDSYYQSLAAARRRIITASIYPIFIIHLGAVLLSIPRGILAGEVAAFGWSVAGILLPVYGLGLVLAAMVVLLRWLVATNRLAERVILVIPVLGALFRNAALTRFCLVLSLGVRSAGGVLNSLVRAGRASGSSCVRAAADAAVPAIRGGAGFAEALGASRIFPTDLERAFRVAEASGRLDEELTRWAEIYRERFCATIEAVSTWLPRLLYLAVCLSVGYQILSLAGDVSSQVNEVLQLE